MEAAAIADAELRVLHSPYGHCAGAPGRFAEETAQVEQAIRELLA
jgi:homoserine O-acetyltransferase